MIESLITNLFGGTTYEIISIFFLSIPYWAPFFLMLAFWQIWISYIRLDAILNEKYVLLEVRLPKDLVKTPKAMEVVLHSLYYTGGESTFIDRAWFGKVRPWFSLELVSIEGNVHFMIWTRAFLKNLVQSQIYAQYPTVEIVEVPDYTTHITYDPKTMSLWGCYFRKDKLDAYPIKTYIDYGIDREGIEESEKTDPIAAVLEYLGGAGKGEQIWIQILIRAHIKEKVIPLLTGKRIRENWTAAAQREIDKIMKRDKKPTEGTFNFGEFLLTKGERAAVEAMERNTGKLPFDVGIRGIYFARNENFNGINVPGLIGSFRQYNTKDLNNFGFYDWTDFDYPWQDFKNMRRDYLKRKILKAYKLRSFFHPPYSKKPFVMSSEELATIYHFPGAVAETPSLERITSRKATAPSNLPI